MHHVLLWIAVVSWRTHTCSNCDPRNEIKCFEYNLHVATFKIGQIVSCLEKEALKKLPGQVGEGQVTGTSNLKNFHTLFSGHKV